jgi:hypothetical protein
MLTRAFIVAGLGLALSCGVEGSRNSDFGDSRDGGFFEQPPVAACDCRGGLCCGGLCCNLTDTCCQSPTPRCVSPRGTDDPCGGG